MKRAPSVKRWLHDSSSMQPDGTLSPQTAQEEHFIYLSLPYLTLYTSLQNLPEKNCLSAKSSVWKGGLFHFHQPRVIFTPAPLPLHAPAHQSLPLPETSLCQFVLLVTLSTYLVPTECLCNQTYTYPVVRHSNGWLIMKLHRCELTAKRCLNSALPTQGCSWGSPQFLKNMLSLHYMIELAPLTGFQVLIPIYLRKPKSDFIKIHSNDPLP